MPDSRPHIGPVPRNEYPDCSTLDVGWTLPAELVSQIQEGRYEVKVVCNNDLCPNHRIGTTSPCTPLKNKPLVTVELPDGEKVAGLVTEMKFLEYPRDL